MAKILSRRKVAKYAAAQLADGKSVQVVLSELAAYLVDSRQVRDADLLARSIEESLVERGITVATVTSARPLNEKQRSEVIRLINSQDVRLKEVVDPTLIGGIRVEAPGQMLDTSINRKLTALMRAKI